jgi:hypothetical protein
VSGFVGAFQVLEYVYAPSGEHVGCVRQRRALEPLGDGRVRVRQTCAPDEQLRAFIARAGDADLTARAMGRFSGEHMFDLAVDGAVRRYLGPAVRGAGFAHGEGAMTGRGVWPEFGYAFRSFSVLVGARRQITGGAFLVGSALAARILGVASPDGDAPPEFLASPSPGVVARVWSGVRRAFAPTGALLREVPVERRYHAAAGEVPAFAGFEERDAEGATDLEIAWEPAGDHLRARGRAFDDGVLAPLIGVGRRLGPALELSAVVGDAEIRDWLEVHDAASGCLICVREAHRDGRWVHTEIIKLLPTPLRAA